MSLYNLYSLHIAQPLSILHFLLNSVSKEALEHCQAQRRVLLLFYARSTLFNDTLLCATLLYTPLHLSTLLYTSTPLRLYTFTPLHLYTFTPLHFYTPTPPHLYASNPLHLYATMVLHLYASKPLTLYTSRPLRRRGVEV